MPWTDTPSLDRGTKTADPKLYPLALDNHRVKAKKGTT